MTKRNTYITVAIVVACVVAGGLVYANWGKIATMFRIGAEKSSYDTGWIELTNGTAAGGKQYSVNQNRPVGDLPLPPTPPPFSNDVMSRWDRHYPTGGDTSKPISLYLGSDAPAGDFNVEVMLNYDSKPENRPQAEPLFIETVAPSGQVVDSVTIRDDVSGPCVSDSPDPVEEYWKIVDTDCSSGGGAPLVLTFVAGGGIRFSGRNGVAPDTDTGSISIGGVRIYGDQAPSANLTLGKSAVKSSIQPGETMEFNINFGSTGTSTKVFFFETFADNDLDKYIKFDESYIAGVKFTDLPASADPCVSGSASGFCFVDADALFGGTGDGIQDTLIGYFDSLAQNYTWNLKLKTLGTIPQTTYNNYVGATSAEMNVGHAYDPAKFFEQFASWNWISANAPVKVAGLQPGLGLTVTKDTTTPQIAPGGEAWFTITREVKNETARHFLFIDGYGWQGATNDIDQYITDIGFDFHDGQGRQWLPATQESVCGGDPGQWGVCLVNYDKIWDPNDQWLDSIVAYNQSVTPGTASFDIGFRFSASVPSGTNLTNIAAVTAQNINNGGQYPTQEQYLDYLNFANFEEFQKWALFNWKTDSATVAIQGGVPPGTPHASLTKSVTPTEGVNPGDTLEYTLAVTNDGGRNLTGMQVIDDYDQAKLQDIAVTTKPGSDDGDKITFDVGDLSVGTSRTLKYTAVVKSAMEGKQINNTANCSSDQYPDPAGVATCRATASVTVEGTQNAPHATLTKVVSPSQNVKPGDTVEYTLTITNDGNTTLHNMEVRDLYDATNLTSVAITKGTPCILPGQTGGVCFDVGDLAGPISGKAAATELKYTAQVKDQTANGTQITNNANCQSDEFPTSITDACLVAVDFTVTEGISPADQSEPWVEKKVDKATAKMGNQLTYTVTAGNRGKGEATHVWVIDSLLFTDIQGQVRLPDLQAGAGKLNIGDSAATMQTALEDSLGIATTESPSANTVDQRSVKLPDGRVRYYKDLPGDNAVTGLSTPLSPTLPEIILDLDRDGTKDTIIYLQNATWPGVGIGTGGANNGLQITKKPYTSVRKDLDPGTYRIVNTGVVIKFNDSGAPEVYNDPAATTVTVEGPVAPVPTIGVAKTVSDNDETDKTSNTASASEVLTYKVTYTNTGKSVAHSAFIEDDYDERYVKITDNGGAQDTGAALLWTLGDVKVGEKVTKTFKAQIHSDVTAEGVTFKNIATIGARGATDQRAETSTKVPAKGEPENQPYLTMTKTFVNENGGAVKPGDTIRYTVTITNDGKAAAVNVEAEDTLPSVLEDMKIVSIPEGAKDQSSGNHILITGFTVEAGASVQIVYTAKVKSDATNGAAVTNDITVTVPSTQGTTTTTSSGRVGSAFTGPGTGSAEAGRVAAAAGKAAETGGNPLTTALVVIGLALAAGITAVILRKRSLAS